MRVSIWALSQLCFVATNKNRVARSAGGRSEAKDAVPGLFTPCRAFDCVRHMRKKTRIRSNKVKTYQIISVTLLQRQ